MRLAQFQNRLPKLHAVCCSSVLNSIFYFISFHLREKCSVNATTKNVILGYSTLGKAHERFFGWVERAL